MILDPHGHLGDRSARNNGPLRERAQQADQAAALTISRRVMSARNGERPGRRAVRGVGVCRHRADCQVRTDDLRFTSSSPLMWRSVRWHLGPAHPVRERVSRYGDVHPCCRQRLPSGHGFQESAAFGNFCGSDLWERSLSSSSQHCWSTTGPDLGLDRPQRHHQADAGILQKPPCRAMSAGIVVMESWGWAWHAGGEHGWGPA